MFKQLDTLGKTLYLGTITPLFLALFTPLLVHSAFLFPFITPKTIVFRILIELAVFFYILLALRQAEFRPRFTKLTTALLVFAGVITLASLLGVDVSNSFWGNIERGEGLLTLFHLWAFFFILPQIFISHKNWLWFLHSSVFVSVLAGIYAVLQILNVTFVIQGGVNRIASTIGNPSFFAGYLLFGIFIAAYLLSQLKTRGWRVYYILVLLFQLFILVRTETRGSFLGLVAGVLISSLLVAIFAKRRKLKLYGAAIILGIFILGGAVWSLRGSSFVQNGGLLHRLSTISTTNITTESRLLTWDSSWQGFKDRPLLGYGWENYNVAFNKYFHAEIFHDAGSQIWFDRAHNIVFDILVTSGLLGFLAFIGLWLYAFRILYIQWRAKQDLPSFVIFSGLLVAYLLQNLFVFDVLATYISIFVVLGFVVHLEKNQNDSASRASTKENSLNPFALATVALVLAALLVAAIVNFNIKPASANIKAVQGLVLGARGQFAGAAEAFRQAIKPRTNQSVEVRQKFAELALTVARAEPQEASTAQLLTDVINEIKDNIREHPFNAQHYLFLMILYNNSDQYDARRIDALFRVSERLIELSPTRPQIYFELGQAYLSRRDAAQAIAAFKKAVDLQPEAVESRLNLAYAYAVVGDIESRDKEFAQLEALGFKVDSVDNLRRLSLIYTDAQNWTELIAIYEKLTEIDPNDALNWARLADTYDRVSLREAAIEAARQAVKLDPSLQLNPDILSDEAVVNPTD